VSDCLFVTENVRLRR